MPVWLDAVPARATKVVRPATRRWLLLLALMMAVGIALTLWGWSSGRSGFAFWFSALGLPFCLWGLLFALRRFLYQVQQVAAASRNLARERLIEHEINRGQRCAWILDTSIQTAGGNNAAELLAALKGAAPVSEFSRPRGGEKRLRYAALTAFQSNLTAELQDTLARLASRVARITESLPAALPCWLLLECDSDLSPVVAAPLNAELVQKTGRVFRLVSGKGMAAFDAWLDTRWHTPGILVAVTLSLPAAPGEGDADAISLMVLSNRSAIAWPDACCLHRPERGAAATLTKTVQRALLWAKVSPGMLRGGWISGAILTRGGGWNSACEENAVGFSLSQDNHSLDLAPGYCAHAAPWLAITLAAAAAEPRGVQVIAAQPAAEHDEVWVAVITKEEVCKESPAHV